jgi:hypothetical protein
MKLVEVDLCYRAVLVVDDDEDIESIKIVAAHFDNEIVEEIPPYSVKVLPFDPAAWDFKEYPSNGELTIGEYWEGMNDRDD